MFCLRSVNYSRYPRWHHPRPRYPTTKTSSPDSPKRDFIYHNRRLHGYVEITYVLVLRRMTTDDESSLDARGSSLRSGLCHLVTAMKVKYRNFRHVLSFFHQVFEQPGKLFHLFTYDLRTRQLQTRRHRLQSLTMELFSPLFLPYTISLSHYPGIFS